MAREIAGPRKQADDEYWDMLFADPPAPRNACDDYTLSYNLTYKGEEMIIWRPKKRPKKSKANS